mmetsp:Transcript_15637/g.37062  ORF Transcript_15637/g.37062 Transcript_15637/m.37062 type:complete len:299 (+) Transcript_15637:840-1736(+)
MVPSCTLVAPIQTIRMHATGLWRTPAAVVIILFTLLASPLGLCDFFLLVLHFLLLLSFLFSFAGLFCLVNILLLDILVFILVVKIILLLDGPSRSFLQQYLGFSSLARKHAQLAQRAACYIALYSRRSTRLGRFILRPGSVVVVLLRNDGTHGTHKDATRHLNTRRTRLPGPIPVLLLLRAPLLSGRLFPFRNLPEGLRATIEPIITTFAPVCVLPGVRVFHGLRRRRPFPLSGAIVVRMPELISLKMKVRKVNLGPVMTVLGRAQVAVLPAADTVLLCQIFQYLIGVLHLVLLQARP